MSNHRIKPLMQHHDDVHDQIEVITSAGGIWAVVHEGKPISICLEKGAGDERTQRRYKKTSFPTIAFAIRLADRLNTLFNVDTFSVKELTHE